MEHFMKFFYVGLGKNVTPKEIKEIIAKKFPDAILYQSSFEEVGTVLDRMNISNINDENKKLILFELNDNPSEFPCVIDFHIFQFEVPDMRIDIFLARYFSEILHCRTIADGTGLGLGSSPYYSIVFDNGRAYLADDSFTKFAYDGEQAVRINKEIDIGNLKNR
jgi:hypothetical protein